MAIAFSRVARVSRSTGGNACCKGSYNARTSIKDENTNVTYNFANRGDNIYHEILLPEHVDSKFKDTRVLMNAVERAENRKNSQLLKEFLLALPDEKNISLDLKIEMVHEFIKESKFVENGLAVQIDIHNPHDGEKNSHAHLLVPTRRFTEDGMSLGAKARDLEPTVRRGISKIFAKSNDELKLWEIWRDVQNRVFEKHRLENRVDPVAMVTGEHIGPIRMRKEANKVIEERNEVRKQSNLEILKTGDGVLDIITKNQSIFTVKDLERAVKYIDGANNKQQLVKEALSSGRVIELFKDELETTGFYTTKEVRTDEMRALRIASKVNDNSNRFIAPGKAVDSDGTWDSVIQKQGKVIDRHKDLSGVQLEAVKHLLLSKQGVRVLKGRAGTGKSHVLGKVASIASNSGQHVIGIAPTNRAAMELQSQGYDECYTAKAFLFRLRNGKVELPRHSLLVVDEAGMVDTETYRELFKAARWKKCNMILAGDERQLSSIERGGMFELFAERFGCYELSDIRRQEGDWGKEIATSMAKGDVKPAISILTERGNLEFSNDKVSSIQSLLAQWQRSNYETVEKLVITIKNSDVDLVNSGVRQMLKALGELGALEYQVGKDINNRYARLERVVFKETNRELRVLNGEFGVLTHVTQDQFVVLTDKGSEISFDPGQFTGFKHGYASTIYKAQGASIKDVYVLHDGFSTARNSYVEMTRHVHDIHFYCNKEATKSVEMLASQLSRIDYNDCSLKYLTREDIEFRHKTGIFDRFTRWAKDALQEIGDLLHTDDYYYEYQFERKDQDSREKIAEVLDNYHTAYNQSLWGNELNEKTREVQVLDKAVGAEQYSGRFIAQNELLVLKNQLKLKSGQIAYSLLGEPNSNLSNGNTLRYGESGKLAITITGEKSGIWYNFAENKGGDMLGFIQEHKGVDFKEAVGFARGLIANDNNIQVFDLTPTLKDHTVTTDNAESKISKVQAIFTRSKPISNMVIDYSKVDTIKYNVPDNLNEILREYASKAIKNRGDVYQARLEKELQTIETEGYAEDFLIAANIAKVCDHFGIRKEIRGSSSSSLTAFALGVHRIDPIKHDLMFERFLGSGNKPDFDFDIDSSKRHIVENYLTFEYKDRAARMAVLKDGELSPHVCAIGIKDEGSHLEIKNGMFTKDYRECEEARKFDLLSSKELTRLSKIAETAGITDTIPLNDNNTYKLIASGEVENLFQIKNSSRICKELASKTFNDLVNLGAAIRPGAKGSIDVLSGREQSNIPDPEHVFASTKGAILFQEQIMKAAHKYFGVPLDETNSFRKNLAAGKIDKETRADYISNSPIKDADKLFSALEEASGFVFNKAHATAYAYATYKAAYVKANYPEEFNKVYPGQLEKSELEDKIAKSYLVNHRGIKDELPSDIRVMRMKCEYEIKPTIVAFARDKDGEITGCQFIHLDKITGTKIDTGIAKKSFGVIKGSFVEVQKDSLSASGGKPKVTLIAEGLETALSIKEAGVEGRILCSLGVSNIKNYEPSKGEHVIICADNDGAHSTSEKVVENARLLLEEKAASVTVIQPEMLGDYNDVLKLHGAHVIKNQIEPIIAGIKEQQALRAEHPEQKLVLTKLSLEQVQERIDTFVNSYTIAELLPENATINDLKQIVYQYAFNRIDSLEMGLFSEGRVKALIIRGLFEMTYEKNVSDVLHGNWYIANNDKPMPVSEKLSIIEAASNITKMSGHEVEKLLVDNPKEHYDLSKIKDPIILSSIVKYQIRETVIKDLVKNNELVKQVSHLGNKFQRSIAEQLVDHIWQGGSSTISTALFSRMQQSATIEQKLTPVMQQQISKELQAGFADLKISIPQQEKDLTACMNLVAGKIRNYVHGGGFAANNQNHAKPISIKHEEKYEVHNLDHKIQRNILQQTMKAASHAQEKLRIQLRVQQQQQQQLQQNIGMNLTL